MDELMALLNIPEGVAEVTLTSDGFFLARASGDIGFNMFLGRPSFHPGPGRDLTRRVWGQLTFAGRRRAIRQARRFRIPIRRLLGGER